MPIQRFFLGLERPALVSAADELRKRATVGSRLDLRNTVVVVPGRRAGRRFLEILVAMAESQRLMLSPPEIETVGRLPEQLYPLKRSLASDLTQQLAWAEVLRKSPPAEIAAIIPFPPDDEDDSRWLELGDMLRRQHAELAADGLDFAAVVRHGDKLPGFTEQARWQTLHRLQQRYLRRLDDLELWDVQTARLFAIEHRECRTTRDIVLIGTVDMNRALRQMLDQVADRVTTLIFAPESWFERFDEHGCVIPDRWENEALSLDAKQIHVVSGPSDQADAVVRGIADWNGRYRADEITIGVPDEKLVPTLQRRMDEFRLPSRWGPGDSITTTGPYRLLAAVSQFLLASRFADFAALVRHPDLFALISEQVGPHAWLDLLDHFQNDRLPEMLPPDHDWSQEKPQFQPLGKLHAWLQDLLSPCDEPPRALGDWSEPIVSLLMRVYGRRPLNRNIPTDRTTLQACEVLHDQLQMHRRVPGALSPRVTASEAIQFALDHTATETIPALAKDTAIELLGWLELPLDDAPALIVTNVNEGVVPESLNADLFLPNTLRSQLGLLDNPRRYARDAYALSVLAASRRELRLIVGRRNGDGDPLIPSRLFFATDRETAARRALTFFDPSTEAERPRPLPATLIAPRERANFPIVRPTPTIKEFESLSVTSFRAYLSCPYRFYLRYVLRLEPLRDDAEELDGAAFGTLLHEVMKRFGESQRRDSTDADEIRRLLNVELNAAVRHTYGQHPLPTVAIQIEQLRARLHAFADVQAAWAADGWRIRYTEVPDFSDRNARRATLDVDGRSIQINGRIDRIDYREATNEWAVIDYKTSDAGTPPEKTHRKKDEWIDLQLPLYRHLLRTLDGVGEHPKLGYLLLPKDVTQCGFAWADWSAAELDAADDVARDVVRCIRRQEFWPPTEPPPPFSEDFAPLCQDGVFDKASGS